MQKYLKYLFVVSLSLCKFEQLAKAQGGAPGDSGSSMDPNADTKSLQEEPDPLAELEKETNSDKKLNSGGATKETPTPLPPTPSPSPVSPPSADSSATQTEKPQDTLVGDQKNPSNRDEVQKPTVQNQNDPSKSLSEKAKEASTNEPKPVTKKVSKASAKTHEKTSGKSRKRKRKHTDDLNHSGGDSGEVQNAADPRIEKKFHDIYEKFNDKPTSEEAWGTATAKRSQSYLIQKGDNLWNISRTFFGDPFFWPKIWSLNASDILNPHEINEGHGIQFVPGNLDNPPSVGLNPTDGPLPQVPTSTEPDKAGPGASEKSTPVAPPSLSPSTIVGPSGEKVAVSDVKQLEDFAKAQKDDQLGNLDSLIPPGKKSTPLLRKIPQSFPPYSVTVYPNDKNVKVETFRNPDVPAEKFLSHYVAEALPNWAGEVVETNLDLKTVGIYETAFVKIEGTPQKRYMAVQEIEEFSVDAQTGTAANLHLLEIQGEIEVIEKVSREQNIYRVFVTKSLLLIEKGSKLVPGRIPRFSIRPSEVNKSVKAKIISSQNGIKHSILGIEEIAFLDAGASQGLKVGDSLLVYSNTRLRKEATFSQINDEPIGLLKVVKTENNFSSALLIQANDAPLIGDSVGARE